MFAPSRRGCKNFSPPLSGSETLKRPPTPYKHAHTLSSWERKFCSHSNSVRNSPVSYFSPCLFVQSSFQGFNLIKSQPRASKLELETPLCPQVVQESNKYLKGQDSVPLLKKNISSRFGTKQLTKSSNYDDVAHKGFERKGFSK